MTHFAGLALAFRGRDEDDLAAVRTDTLVMLIAVLLGLSFVASMLPIPSWNPIPLVAGLWVTAGAMYWALRYGPAVATLAMVLGLMTTLTALLYVYPGDRLVDYYCFVVLAACGAYNWRFGLATASLISGLILRVMQAAPGILPAEAAYHSLMLVWI